MKSLTERLAADGYWPARAFQFLEAERYSDVVRICRDNFSQSPELVSGRIAYAIALYQTGQEESAASEFRFALSLDPENLVALKYLGDIMYAAGDAAAAVASYERIMEIDPYCRGLRYNIDRKHPTTTRTITLARGSEGLRDRKVEPLREIPFFTETIGDLYLAQGYPRMAAEVFRKLSEQSGSPRLTEKLARAEEKIKQKED